MQNFSLKQYNEAIKDYNQAIELNPRSNRLPQAYNSIAWL